MKNVNCFRILTYGTQGTISRAGLLSLKKPIGATVPYEICPRRVKRVLQMIADKAELPIELFKSKASHNSALCNMYIYGYLRDVDQTILAARKARSISRKRWGEDNPDKIKIYYVDSVHNNELSNSNA
jgi:hypothetical protein